MYQLTTYRFPSAAAANRFLAELQGLAVGPCAGRRYPDDHSIQVEYSLSDTPGFSQAQALDDLASRYDGREID